MTRAELLTIDFSGKTVVIIGNPATGKTTLARLNDLQKLLYVKVGF